MENKLFAKVVWTAADIAILRPQWSRAKCEDWLRSHATAIQDRLVEHGWEVIGALLTAERRLKMSRGQED